MLDDAQRRLDDFAQEPGVEEAEPPPDAAARGDAPMGAAGFKRPPSSGSVPRVLDWRRVKAHVRRHLAPDDPLRVAILAEPDEAAMDQILLGRLLVMVRLTYHRWRLNEKEGGAV